MSTLQRPGHPPTTPRLVALSTVWLDQVMPIEQAAYAFPWTRGNFVDSLAAGYPMHGLADDEGTLLGYMVAMNGVDEVHLLNLTVAPELQGRGLAQQLLGHLYAHARSRGASHVWLEVRESNRRARALYARQGFVQVGLRRNYYPDDGERREHAVVMRRDLRSATDGEEASHALD